MILAVCAVISLAALALLFLPSQIYPPEVFEKIALSAPCADASPSAQPNVSPSAVASTPASPDSGSQAGGSARECEDSAAAGLRVQAASAAAAAQNGARQALGVVMAALIATAAAAAGVRINNKTVRQAKRHHDEIQAQARMTAIDDRFSAAVKQLGDTAAPVRVGALHSLHGLALSEPERLSTILEVLCAYLRQPFHHPDFDREAGDTAPLPFGRTGWDPTDSPARDARDAEREVRRTCAELLPDLLPSAASVRSGLQRPPLLRLRRASLDSLKIANKGFSLDILNTSFAEALTLSGCHIDGDLNGIDASFSSLSMHGCDVSGEIFFEDVTAYSLYISGTTTDSLILNGSKSRSMSFHKCTLKLLDVSNCTTGSFRLDETTMGGLSNLRLDDFRIQEGNFTQLPKGVNRVVLSDDIGHFSLKLESQAGVGTR
jgi:hypothetical protein